ncbi:hypothetical protein ACOSQ4_030829 [Xanthoceras sorbifolium]
MTSLINLAKFPTTNNFINSNSKKIPKVWIQLPKFTLDPPPASSSSCSFSSKYKRQPPHRHNRDANPHEALSLSRKPSYTIPGTACEPRATSAGNPTAPGRRRTQAPPWPPPAAPQIPQCTPRLPRSPRQKKVFRALLKTGLLCLRLCLSAGMTGEMSVSRRR